MPTPRYNKLACLKEISAIEYRVADINLPPSIRRACIKRNVENLIAELGHNPKYAGILERLAANYVTELEIVAGCALLRSLIPLTYGCCPAGVALRLPGKSEIWIKRKGGVQRLDSDFIHPHIAADTRVVVVNT